MLSQSVNKLLVLTFEALGYNVSSENNKDSELIKSLNISTVSLGNDLNEIVLAYKNSIDDGWVWFFPAQTKKPLYLTKPQPFPIASQNIGTATKLAYTFGLGSAQADGKIYIQWKTKSPFEVFGNAGSFTDFLFYLKPATRVGEAYAALGKDGNVNALVKIGLNAKQFSLIANEAVALEKWHGNLPFVEVSQKLAFSDNENKGFLISGFDSPKKTKQFETFGKPHLAFLGTMYERSVMRGPLNYAPFWHQISNQVQELGGLVNLHASDPVRQELPNKLNLNQLTTLSSLLIDTWQQLDDYPEVFVAFSHGNLNPTNCYLSADRFYAYNWEHCHAALPVLFDLFQFYFREDMLLVGKGDIVVRKSIDQALKLPEAQALIKTFLVEPEQYYLMFLLWRLSADALFHAKLFMPNSKSQNLLNIWLKVFDEAIKRLQ
jgi:hypothetical protein